MKFPGALNCLVHWNMGGTVIMKMSVRRNQWGALQCSPFSWVRPVLPQDSRCSHTLPFTPRPPPPADSSLSTGAPRRDVWALGAKNISALDEESPVFFYDHNQYETWCRFWISWASLSKKEKRLYKEQMALQLALHSFLLFIIYRFHSLQSCFSFAKQLISKQYHFLFLLKSVLVAGRWENLFVKQSILTFLPQVSVFLASVSIYFL